jgi:predicted DNA-binding transcriptional regulator YafY
MNQVIEFEYQKFEDTVSKLVKLQLHLLKEDRHRWYVLGRINGHDDPTTVYALDRILAAKILEEKFEPAEFNFDQYFAHSFGITVTNDEPVDVILSFTPFQGNYLKTLKIHHTQVTLVDNEAEYRISVRVIPSWEFYEKILGYGHCVKVVSPEIIIEEVKKKAALITKLYQ